MIGTGEIVMLVFLALLLGIATWWFVVAFQYGKSLKTFEYARGANLDPGPNNTKGSVSFKCDSDRSICLSKATAICTGAINSQSNTESIDGIYATGMSGNLPYGAFDTEGGKAIDLTTSLAGKVNGKQSYTYNFDGGAIFGGKCVGPAGSFVRPQLIATYTCIPSGKECKVPTS